MKVELESTTRFVEADGLRMRVWQGETAAGIPVVALIVRVAVERTQDTTEFERELQEHAAPRADVVAFPLRFFLD
ncbi:MAG TPA: hypothetical protein VES65_11390 [Solirubrobacteraceae bacterium]|nr:hypothetical protein [Solirubrobacteraceae bacterium]